MQRILQRAATLAAITFAFVCATSVHADGGQHVLWAVTGKQNTVYLLGSVHILHTSDSALPQPAIAAYADAERVVEEIDLLAAAGDLLNETNLALQLLPAGQTLAAALGPELHAELQKTARTYGIDTDFMSRFQPWYAAMLLQQVQMMRSGYSPLSGVDFQIAQRAQRDGKPLTGLETVKDQLSLFGALPIAEQREFLAATLRETDMRGKFAEITQAWRRGDLAHLEELLRQGAAESPALFKSLTTDRNLRWLPQIEQMLQHPEDDYLVVAGALHMVGETGLISLLKQKGYRVERH